MKQSFAFWASIIWKLFVDSIEMKVLKKLMQQYNFSMMLLWINVGNQKHKEISRELYGTSTFIQYVLHNSNLWAPDKKYEALEWTTF